MPPAKRQPRAAAVGDENKNSSPAVSTPAGVEPVEADGSKHAIDTDYAETPIHDRLMADLQSATDEERTTFEEDDDTS